MARQTQVTTPVREASARARETVREAGPGLIWLGRCGLAAKGVVYVLIGIVAARAALGSGEETTDSHGALGRVVQMPLGPLLLGAIALGLAGYTTWRIVQALVDTENKDSDLEGLAVRGGYLLSGLIHAALTLTAARILLSGSASASNEEGAAQDWTARLLEQPLGPWLVAVAGLSFIGLAAVQLFRAATAKFREQLQTGRMSDREKTFAIWAGRAGHVARGVTFAIMGLFLVLAAFRQEAGEAKGLAGALDTLAQQPYGPYLLLIVAAGLMLYGLYMFVEARYRRMVIS